jgi:[ribosomal protein S5]-alanine N-acetyltransferase
VRATRLISHDDAADLAALIRDNREFLAPWEPCRAESFFTLAGQQDAIAEVLARAREGSVLPHVILDPSGRLVGRITLNGIVRGPFQSCSVGYWVGEADNGRGLASAAVADIIKVAFGELGLHRIQAETLLHNTASQRVLQRNGFVYIGAAAGYLNIAGRWQDHHLYQVLNPRPERRQVRAI